ncbi:MAG: D-sedoheptulose 7-phosphate isomerase [Thermoplasmata archaeon]
MEIKDIQDYLNEGARIRLSINAEKLKRIGDVVANSLKSGKKIILMGNGGSAADAQHIAAEFIGRFEKERKPLPALVLHGNTSTITAIGNDYGFEKVFERQIEAFANPGDIVIALSTSGNSVNVINGIRKAMEMGCIIIGITGRSGGKMSLFIDDDYLIRIDSNRTPFIQEATITIGHIISKIVEDKLF